ncbi:glycogen debranching N-terminal domain-containing protein [Deinococcus yavapaiensis]|uniref:Glycogen debranching enzyme n=1 Tax=Deinococcus yavapaiensis KR-236 TaxID=694435 RepID=A0A318S8F2_9DEIO|nr:glycogen debranching N-terminal domain-containing protein [Deinococcus yavapaiensis]PYE51902.1 glycogen debranching enzyme [Deinococcus yavapaiensis KR-236]
MFSSRSVLKENELYFVGDGTYVAAHGEAGLYRRDTRFLSRYEWRLDGERPQPLVQHARLPWWLHEVAGNANLGYTMHTGLTRDLQVTGADLRDRVRVTRYKDVARELKLWLSADFRDMFEVRAAVGDEGDWPTMAARGVTARAVEGGVEFAYTASDGLATRTVVQTTPPGRWDGEGLVWNLAETTDVEVRVFALKGDETPSDTDVNALVRDYEAWGDASFTLADPRDQGALQQSLLDLRSLVFRTPYGPFPAAGLPWFVAPFGRDSVIMALLVLPHRPDLSLGVARYLAAKQGKRHDPHTLEQPGKILHEERDGELTRTGKTPHRPYFGTVDATPLFAWLVGEIARVDAAAGRELRPNLEAALTWMETLGDPDGDGFLEYTPDRKQGGIGNQVWKDSGDSTFDQHGRDAEGHIAIVEVQGYAFAAYEAAADFYDREGEAALAARFREKARTLQHKFHEAFWWPERSTYVHGLNGDKTPLKVLVSNAAHALWTGIVPREHAADVTKTALSPELWSGWGIRTLGVNEPRFNPVSYHNGSVWPHDTAVAALGMARYGLLGEAKLVARALFDAARWAPDARLPELFAGFSREDGPPVPYPAACHPQGWDAVLPLALAHLLDGVEALSRAAD